MKESNTIKYLLLAIFAVPCITFAEISNATASTTEILASTTEQVDYVERIILQAPIELESVLSVEEQYTQEKSKSFTKEFIYLNSTSTSVEDVNEKIFNLYKDESFQVSPEREAELLELMEDGFTINTVASRTTPFELNSLVKTKNKKAAVKISPKIKKVKELEKSKNKSNLNTIKNKNKSLKNSVDRKSLQDQVKQLNKKIKEEKEKLVKENLSNEEQKQIDYIEGNYLYLSEEDIFVPSEDTKLNNWAQNAIISEYKNIYSTNASPTRQIIVAVIDAGVDYRHIDLANNMWSQKYCVDENNNQMPSSCANGYDFVDNDFDPSPTDNASHGTAVAGLVGAVTDNKVGIASLSQNRVKIMALRVADNGVIELENIIRAIYFATNNGANVINMSLSGPTYSQAFYDALQYAESRGVKVVVSAGNMGQDLDTTPAYPASYNLSNIFTVASMDENGALSSYSNYSNSVVDVITPGRNVLSTNPGNTFSNFSGTSFSAPIFSSLVVRWLSENKNVDEEIAKLNENEYLKTKIKNGKTLSLSSSNTIPVIDTEFISKSRIQKVNGIYLDTQAKGGAVVSSTTNMLNSWLDSSVGMPYQISPGSSDINSAPTISGTAITFYWQSAANASTYGFYLTNQTTGASYIFLDNLGYTTSYYVSGLTPGHTYRWNTSARRNTASSYNIPPVYYFKVPGGSTAPNTPGGINFGSTASPGPLVSTNNQNVSWNADSNTSYYVFTNCITTGGCQTQNINSTTYSLPTSVKGYYYYFYLKACNSAGQCSANSSSYFYNTVVPNTNPGSTIISGVSSTNINIQNSFGMTASDGDNDQIKYQMDWGDGNVNVSSLMNQGTTGYLSKTYTVGGTKCLKAQAIDSKNQYGPQSSCFNLNVIAPTPVVPSAPTNISPSYPASPGQQINDGPYNISWSSSGAAYFSVVWRNLTDNLTYEQTTTNNYFSIPGLVKGKNYIWDIAACNSNGCSTRSVNNYFYISAGNSMPNTPQLTTTKVSALVGEELTFNFFSSDADGDTLRYELSFGETITELYQTNFVTQGVTQNKIYNYQASGNYCARARAVDSKGSYSPYSACTYINVTGQPQKPDLYIEQMSIQNTVYNNGQNVPISFVIKNLGGVDASTGYKIGIYIKSVSVENKIGEYVGSALLPKLSSKTETIYVTLPVDRNVYFGSGNYNIFFVADSENSLPEVNENNNTFAAPVTVNLVGTTVDSNEPSIYFDTIGDQEVGSKVAIYLNSKNIPVGSTLSIETEGGAQLGHNTVTVSAVNFLQLNANELKSLLESVFNTPSENARLKVTHQGTKTFYSNYFKVKTKKGTTASTSEKTFSYILKDSNNNKISGVNVTVCPASSLIDNQGFGSEYCKSSLEKITKVSDQNGFVSFKLSEVKSKNYPTNALHFEVVINTATDTKYVTTWGLRNLNTSVLENVKVIKGFDTIHNPIILVPGIMGSSMKSSGLNVIPYISGNPTRDDLIIADGTADLGIDVAGVYVLGWDRIRTELEKYGYVRGKTIIDCPYDWRYSVENSATNYFAKCVEEAQQKNIGKKVDVIAHSMGGLVTRAYIQKVNKNNAEKFGKIFFVGTPHLGSTDAYSAWEGGDPNDDTRNKILNRTYKAMNNGISVDSIVRSKVQDLYSIFGVANYDGKKYYRGVVSQDEEIFKRVRSKEIKNFLETKSILGVKQLLPIYSFLRFENQTNLSKIIGKNQNELLVSLNGETCSDGLCNEGSSDGTYNFTTLALAKSKVGEMRMYHTNESGKIDKKNTDTFTRYIYDVTPGPDGIFYQDGIPKNIDIKSSDGITPAHGDGTVPVISSADFAQQNGMTVVGGRTGGHAFQAYYLYDLLAKDIAGHAMLAGLDNISLNANESVNRLNIEVNGFVNLLLQNGSESVGVNSVGETVQTFSNLESVNINEASSNFAITTPNIGSYKIILSGPVSGVVNVYVDFVNPQTSKVTVQEFSVYHTGGKTETFEFDLNSLAETNEELIKFNQKIFVAPKVLKTANENSLTKIVMEKEKSTSTNPVAYRLYSKTESETNYKYLGKITNSAKMEILTFDSFAGINNDKIKLYRVVGEYADESTTAMSYVFRNNDTDNDGLTDMEEMQSKTNLYVADTDQDGLADGVELNFTNTSPIFGDSDNNGIDDFSEAKIKFDFLEKSTTTEKSTLSLDIVGELNELVATSTIMTLPVFTTSTTTIMVPTIVKSTTTREVEMWVDKLVDVEKIIEVATVTKKEIIEEIISTSTKIIELINSTTSVWRTSLATSSIIALLPETKTATVTVNRFIVSTSSISSFATVTVATTSTTKVPVYITKMYGKKETLKNSSMWDEFINNNSVPTLLVSKSSTDISTIRPWIGYTNGFKKSQRISLSGLVVGSSTKINLGIAATVNNKYFYAKAVSGSVKNFSGGSFTVPGSQSGSTIKYATSVPTVRTIIFIPETENVTIEIGTDETVNNYLYFDFIEIYFLPKDSYNLTKTTTNIQVSVPTTTVATTTTIVPVSYPNIYAVLLPKIYTYSTSTYKLVDVVTDMKELVSTTSKLITEISTGTKSQILNLSATSSEQLLLTKMNNHSFSRRIGELEATKTEKDWDEFVSTSTSPTVVMSTSTYVDTKNVREFVGNKNGINYTQRFSFSGIKITEPVPVFNIAVIVSKIVGQAEYEYKVVSGSGVIEPLAASNNKFLLSENITSPSSMLLKLTPQTSDIVIEIRQINPTPNSYVYFDNINSTFSEGNVRPFDVLTPTEILENKKIEIATTTKTEILRNVATVTKIIDVISTSTVTVIVQEIKKVLEKVLVEEQKETIVNVQKEVASSSVLYVQKLVTSTTTKQISEKVEIGSIYNDRGARAYDKIDGDLTNKISTSTNLDMNKIGLYEIIYSIKNNFGEILQKIRQVEVVEPVENTIIYDNFDRSNNPTINGGWADSVDDKEILNIVNNSLSAKWTNLPWGNFHSIFRPISKQNDLIITYKWKVASGATVDGHLPYVGLRAGNTNTYADSYGVSLIYIPQNATIDVVIFDKGVQLSSSKAVITNPKTDTFYNVEIKVSKENWVEFRMWEVGGNRPAVSMLIFNNGGTAYIPTANGSNLITAFTHGSRASNSVNVEIDDFKVVTKGNITLQSLEENTNGQALEILNLDNLEAYSFFEVDKKTDEKE